MTNPAEVDGNNDVLVECHEDVPQFSCDGSGAAEKDPLQGKGRMGFEEALDLTGFGKFNYFVIFIGGLNMISVLLELLGISFVLPVSECDMNLTTQDKGVLSGVAYAGACFCH